MEALAGQQLNPHQIIEPLGEGGMASVYKAYHQAYPASEPEDWPAALDNYSPLLEMAEAQS